jgi:hypothetical protein
LIDIKLVTRSFDRSAVRMQFAIASSDARNHYIYRPCETEIFDSRPHTMKMIIDPELDH